MDWGRFEKNERKSLIRLDCFGINFHILKWLFHVDIQTTIRIKMSSASATIQLFDNENIINETKPALNYFERTIQPIFDEIKTTEDLILWCVIVISICVGLILNLLVIRSILRIKCNGLYFTVEFLFVAFLKNSSVMVNSLQFCSFSLFV